MGVKKVIGLKLILTSEFDIFHGGSIKKPLDKNIFLCSSRRFVLLPLQDIRREGAINFGAKLGQRKMA